MSVASLARSTPEIAPAPPSASASAPSSSVASESSSAPPPRPRPRPLKARVLVQGSSGTGMFLDTDSAYAQLAPIAPSLAPCFADAGQRVTATMRSVDGGPAEVSRARIRPSDRPQDAATLECVRRRLTGFVFKNFERGPRGTVDLDLTVDAQ
jgi:hypothetical protein